MAERLRSASNSKYPLASVIDDPDTFKRAIHLLKECTINKVKQSELKEQEDELKTELAAICSAYNLPGIRHGLDCFEYFGWKTKQTLSKERLLALGVTAEQIAQAYVDSDPFLMTKITPFDLE